MLNEVVYISKFGGIGLLIIIYDGLFDFIHV